MPREAAPKMTLGVFVNVYFDTNSNLKVLRKSKHVVPMQQWKKFLLCKTSSCLPRCKAKERSESSNASATPRTTIPLPYKSALNDEHITKTRIPALYTPGEKKKPKPPPPKIKPHKHYTKHGS